MDLVDLRKVSTVFQAQIIGEGEVIYAKDKNKMNELFIRIFKQYMILNEERKPILERIGKFKDSILAESIKPMVRKYTHLSAD